MKEMNKRLVEVDEVLKNLNSSDYSKLPNELISLIENSKDPTYQWKYDSSKELVEQNLPHDTICILSYINSEYLLNDKQKEYFRKLHEENSKEFEKEKLTKYNPDEIFKKKEKPINNSVLEEELSLIKQEDINNSIFSRVISFFKNIFKKK